MESITIPAEGRGNNPLTVFINGVKYTLSRGTEITVDAAVAAEVQRMLRMPLITGSGYTDDPRALPLVTDDDAGKILMVDENGKWAAADAPTELPEVAVADAGKVLMVDEEGAWTAAVLPADDSSESA